MATTPSTTPTNAKAKACAAYVAAKAAGQSNKAAAAKANAVAPVGHALLDLAWYASPSNHTRSATPVLRPVPTPAQRGQAAALLRAGKGWEGQYVGTPLSHGRITVALGLFDPANPGSAEGQVRTAFSTTTGLAAEGQRIGGGGRWLGGQPLYYAGNHKAHGVQAAKPRTLDPAQVAATAGEWQPVLPKVAAQVARQVAAAKGKGKGKAKATPATPAPEGQPEGQA